MYNFFTLTRIAGGFLLRKDSFASQPHRKLSRLKSKAKKQRQRFSSESRCFFICAVYEKSFSSLKSEIIVHQDHVNPILMPGEACHQELTADGIR